MEGNVDNSRKVASPKALVQYLVVEEYLVGWKAPHLPSYNGIEDPDNHVHTFTMGMDDMTQR